MTTTPKKMATDNLHLFHAGHDTTTKSSRVDIGDATWRAESGGITEVLVKRAMALRLVACWNILEGIPTTALLEESCVREFYRAALDIAAYLKEAGMVTEALAPMLARLEAADAAHKIEAVTCTCEGASGG